MQVRVALTVIGTDGVSPVLGVERTVIVPVRDDAAAHVLKTQARMRGLAESALAELDDQFEEMIDDIERETGR